MEKSMPPTLPEQGIPDGISEACSNTGVVDESQMSQLSDAVNMQIKSHTEALGLILSAYGLQFDTGIVSMARCPRCQSSFYHHVLMPVLDGSLVKRPPVSYQL